MDSASDLVAEHAVHELVLLDPAEPFEAVGHDLCAEVVPASGEVVHVYPSTGKSVLDASLELGCLGHAFHDSGAMQRRYIS